ncbi:hypothetical protein DCAR_0727540 [Daucus carota subsp. sativus]|uniref:Uncharacterized protein n=1 Tax=Daucus carota subsp. sativus TaxID=79200 RepID=A0A161Y3X1_DAUCS|nr:hypothetical protein DCAR_0727540 [Daucus carota subsp. sativus]
MELMERPLADRSYSPLEAPSGPDIYFQRWLCSLARHERTLKIQLKRHMIAAHHTESVHTALLKKKIAKQARTRRRIVMLSRKLRTDQGLHPLSSLHIMRVCSQPPSHVLSPRARTDLAQSTGSGPCTSSAGFHTPAKRAAAETSQPAPGILVPVLALRAPSVHFISFL